VTFSAVTLNFVLHLDLHLDLQFGRPVVGKDHHIAVWSLEVGTEGSTVGRVYTRLRPAVSLWIGDTPPACMRCVLRLAGGIWADLTSRFTPSPSACLLISDSWVTACLHWWVFNFKKDRFFITEFFSGHSCLRIYVEITQNDLFIDLLMPYSEKSVELRPKG